MLWRMRLLSLLLGLCLGSLAQGAATRWKVVLLAGDASASVFDNARLELGRLLFLSGVNPWEVFDLSADEDQSGTLPATVGSLRYALKRLEVGRGDACLLHLTSHGTKTGFELEQDPPLTPPQLDEMLSAACDPQPTVVLISACYSGIFLAPEMRKPNRILLSAARADRTSFGCDDKGEFNFWDQCLLQQWRHAGDWKGLFDRVASCIQELEQSGGDVPSEPQSYFGREVADLLLPRVNWLRPLPPAPLFEDLWDLTNACYRKADPASPYGDDICE